MNAQNKKLFSRTSTKVILGIAIALGLLAVFSGVLFNLDREIAVQSRAGGVAVRQDFATLPEYGYIQAHQARAIQPVKMINMTGFQALPEYGYIQAHFYGASQEAYLPAGMRNLAEYSYVQAHNRVDVYVIAFAQTILPEGLRALPVFGYIEAHSHPGSETFMAGLPRGLSFLAEAGYIQMHGASQ